MVGTRSSVNTTTENTVDFINNQLQSGFIKIANAANVDIGLLTSHRKRISESLGVWLEEQSLGGVDLEFVTPNETVLESYRFDVTYEGDMGYVEFDAQRVIREVDDYSHRDDVIARVVPVTYRDATDLGWDTRDTEAAITQFTSLPRADTSDVRVQTKGNSLADKLVPTPHTLLQLPKSLNQAYFYYFTDEMYSQADSKYRILDERLTLFGRHRGGVKVILIDRDRILNSVWDTLMDGLGLGDYPVLIAAESSLGIEDVNSDTSEFKPHDVTYTMIEAGIIAEHILEDPDRLNAFLNQLYDGARDGSVRQKMTEKKIINMLTVSKNQVQDLITFSD